MTKEQIVEELKIAAKPYEDYYIKDEVRNAMMQLPNPFELVEPILEIISANPMVEFGMPGDLVHYVERFYKNGYEELLIASVRKKPTAHNIWMVHRCYNDIENPMRGKFKTLIMELMKDKSISEEIKRVIDGFDW